MNKYKRLNERHKGDRYIVGGVILALVLVGALLVWLISVTPSENNSGGDKETTTATSTGSIVPTNTLNFLPLPTDDKITLLAKCLARKKVTMYGSVWCGHCQDNKALFGVAFKYVPYVECPDNTKLCLAKGITGYPTWMKEDGQQLGGFTELEELATFAGCEF